jgi:hypothetical protein
LTSNKLSTIISPRSQGENKEKESPKLQEATRNEHSTPKQLKKMELSKIILQQT